jgi:glycosyltransferase involved in cell wall biosynthesis
MNCFSPVPSKIAFVANYIPRKCGLATFTHDISRAVAKQYPEADNYVIAVNDGKDVYDYPEEVRYEIAEQDREGYRRAAEYVNMTGTELVCIQHEFGIFGGSSGSYILDFARAVRVPVVTTLHTILREPSVEQRAIMDELTAISSRVIVMSEKGRQFLTEIYGVPDEKIAVIAHGIPDVPFVETDVFKVKYDAAGKPILLTFGLLSPNKGIENVINALPEIVKQTPNVEYWILGATHPNLIRESGEAYRESLVALAEKLGVVDNVRFFNQFVSLDDLTEFLGAADIYITPYLNPAQITSGTLAYAFGCGKAVISTPYWHAEELLADEHGVLVPFGNANAIADAVIALLGDSHRLQTMRQKAYQLGRSMIWSEVAQQYMATFGEGMLLHQEQTALPRLAGITDLHRRLPALNWNHLRAMTDSTGIFQHGTFGLPNFAEGYTTDDNARALMVAVLAEKHPHAPRELGQWETAYAAFLNYAFNRNAERFRNFLGYDRAWLEEVGSEDSHGRALWAIGMTAGRTQKAELRAWAIPLFMDALWTTRDFSSPRAWAFTLLGISEFSRVLPETRHVNRLRDQLAAQLMGLYRACSGDKWCWFEDIASYDNAALSQALLVTARATKNAEMKSAGLETLQWLMNEQTTENGIFRPIGSNGFYHRDGAKAQFDQQPLEAGSAVLACAEAWRQTKNSEWIAVGMRAFSWFLGRNDLGLEMIHPTSGGCRDGLHAGRLNQNYGAESLLAYLLARLEVETWEARTHRESQSLYRKERLPSANDFPLDVLK